MAGLFASFNLGSNALSAHRSQISSAGHNIANADTPGHTRTTVSLTAERYRPGGVTAGIRRGTHDNIMARRERQSSAEFGRASDLTQAMDALEGRIADGDRNIVDAIAALFGGITKLAQNPGSLPLRRSLVADAERMGAEFSRSAEAVRQSRSDADARVVNYAESATRLAQEIATSNSQLRGTYDSVVADRRDQASRELSELVGGSGRIDPDGQMRFVMDDGAALVQGELAGVMRAIPDNTLGGFSRVEIALGNNVRDISASLSEGRMGAQIDLRDGVGAQAASNLDQLAFDIANAMNSVHQANAGLDGVSGRDFYTQIAQVQGAASNLVVEQNIIQDPNLIAGADPALGPSDNSGLLSMAALADQTLAGGGTRTFVDDAINTLGAVGSYNKVAHDDLRIAEAHVDQLAGLRDSLSGVSIEEEMTRLSEFQRASEASMRFISTVDSLLDGLINRT